MKALSIAYKDLQILLKDRGSVFELFLLPLLFIVVFSGALNAIGQSSGEKDTRIDLAVVNLDGGKAGGELLAKVDRAGGVKIQLYEKEDALQKLDMNKLPRVLTIPADFSTDMASGKPVTLLLLNHPKSSSQQTEAIRLVIAGVADDLSLETHIIASLKQMGDMQANLPPEMQIFSSERIIAQARSQMERSQKSPLVEVVQTVPKQESTAEKMPDLSQAAVPGMTVLFVFLAAQTTARSVFEEKKVGSFRRLMAAPLSKTTILLGKLLPNFAIALIQIGVIVLFGTLGMRLLGLMPMPVENSPIGVLLVGITMALCSSAFGVMLAALMRTENQVSSLSTLLMWGMGLLGGCVVPLFILGTFLGPIPMIVPHYWANHALDNLLIRNTGLAGVTTDLAALLGFSALFFVIAIWRFDFDR